MVKDPGQFFSGHQWVPVAIGVLISLTVHGAKAAVRPVVNTTTAGVGAPVVSTIEDITSVVLSLVAILLPVLVLVLGVAMVAGFWVLLLRRRRRKAERRSTRIEQGTTRI
jgi:chromate transport protein ChrA